MSQSHTERHQRIVHIDVEYYNEAHRRLLQAYSHADGIQDLVTDGISVGEDELVIHSIFTEQKDRDGFRTYEDLKGLLDQRRAEFHSYFDINDGTIKARYSPDETENHRIERVGVAVSLIAMNRIFGLHEADWQKIGRTKTKDLDFSIALNGSKYIEVESKGSVVKHVRPIIPSVSGHRADIEKKKEAQRSDDNKNDLFGVITSFPTSGNDRALCRLLDPDGSAPHMDPLKYQLLARMTFYLQNLSVISRGRMLVALANRIKVLEAVDNIKNLNGLALVDANGKPIEPFPSIAQGKTTVKENRIVGRTFPLNDKGEFAFFGFDVNVFRILAEQHFDAILSFRSSLEGTSDEDKFWGLVHHRELEDLEIEIEIEPDTPYDKAHGRWRWIPMRGRLVVTGSGRAVAFLKERPRTGARRMNA